MKIIKISIKLISILCLFFIFGCDQSSFLEEKPTSFLDPDALLVNKAGAELYTIGCYDAVRVIATDYTGWASAWGTFATDEIVMPNWAADPKEIYLHSLSTSNSSVRSMWENFYVSINKVNSAVDRINAMTEDQINVISKNKLVAESRYLRAMLYFSMVSTWENIPLIKHETTSLNNLEVAQSTPQEVYDFIIKDLQFAKSVLVVGQGGGRATKGAVQSLLGKVYLQMTGFPLNDNSKYALAETELKEVMDSGVYDLLTYYTDVFSLSNEQSKEMVFAIGADGPGISQGGKLGTFYGPTGNSENGGQAGNNWFVNYELAGTSANLSPTINPSVIGTIPSTAAGGSGTWANRNNYKFAQGYEENDIRCRNNIAKHNVNTGTPKPEDGMYDYLVRKNLLGQRPTWKPWKWHNIRPSNWGSDTPYDDPYIRYADVLLLYAEAINGQNKLTQNIVDYTVNRLRNRARLFPVSKFFPNGANMPNTVAENMVLSNQQDNSDEILSERRKELCFEGWRRNDLIRFGKYQQAIRNTSTPVQWSNCGNPQLQYKDNEIRWPIPTSELQINSKLVQNPGY
ncbi:MAG: hypothetical protein ACI87N_000559 [Flavobacteriales bacterium]|jgi:hypothetical protein